jgi:GNAT superfamily N-acetyltransferase
MSQTQLDIRSATPADAGTLVRLIASAYRGEESRKGWTTEADLVADPRIDEAGLLAKISDPSIVILLAKDTSGTLVACCELLKQEDGVGNFGLFAVDPKRQGGGLGKSVLQAAETYAHKTLGLDWLEMWVIWTRAELISWYIRRGYAQTDRQEPFPYEELPSGKALRDDLYFIVMEKALSAQPSLIAVA